MTPLQHSKACEPLIADMQERLAQAAKTLLEMQAALNSKNYATANIDAQRLVKIIHGLDQPSHFLRGHTFEAAVGIRSDHRG